MAFSLVNNGKMSTLTYGNGLVVKYLYDVLDRVEKIWYHEYEAGSPIGLKYRNNTYASSAFDSFFFEKNLQGDVIAVYNATGTKIGSYTYDAWGNFTTTLTSGNTTLENNIVRYYNPFRYRGYYYDIDLGWYYLQSRYYNPQWGRFLNADGLAFLGSNGDLQAFNLYAYCSNNPITYIDHSGTIAILDDVTVATGVLVVFGVYIFGKKVLDPAIQGISDYIAEKNLPKKSQKKNLFLI